MHRIRILIGDRDGAYVRALVRFLIASGQGFEPRSHTEPEFMDGGVEYDIGLLTTPFMDRLREMGEEAPVFKKLFYLSEGAGDVCSDGCESVRKYQSMDEFMSILLAAVMEGRSKPVGMEGLRRIAVLSPVHHEMLVPYTVSVAKILAERAPTLLVDLQQVSNLPGLLGRQEERNLTDLLYLLAVGAPLKSIPGEFLGYYEGFCYLPPVKPSFSGEVLREADYDRLTELLSVSGYENILMIFDSVIPGMSCVLSDTDEIFMVCKSGAFYESIQEIYRRMLEEAGVGDRVKQIVLPGATISGSGLGVMESLVAGAMGSMIRKGLNGEMRA